MSAHNNLLLDIESFIRSTGMGEAYFGQRAVGNSKLVARLREGRSIQLDTADRIRRFMSDRRDLMQAGDGLSAHMAPCSAAPPAAETALPSDLGAGSPSDGRAPLCRQPPG